MSQEVDELWKLGISVCGFTNTAYSLYLWIINTWRPRSSIDVLFEDWAYSIIVKQRKMLPESTSASECSPISFDITGKQVKRDTLEARGYLAVTSGCHCVNTQSISIDNRQSISNGSTKRLVSYTLRWFPTDISLLQTTGTCFLQQCRSPGDRSDRIVIVWGLRLLSS
jgi:hypothetical protein